MLAAIAAGASQNNQIATAVGLSSTKITYYLKELQRLELVRREVSILGGGRRATYRISDNLFRFWYRFVIPHRPTIERGITARALADVEGRISEYMGPAFEEIRGQWIWRRCVRGELGFDSATSVAGRATIPARGMRPRLTSCAGTAWRPRPWGSASGAPRTSRPRSSRGWCGEPRWLARGPTYATTHSRRQVSPTPAGPQRGQGRDAPR